MMQNYNEKFDTRIAETVAYAAQHSPTFAARLEATGMQPDDIQTVDQLSMLPVLRKENLVELQRENPPFGGMLMVDVGSLRRVYQSPGPINEPEPDVSDYWRWKSALVALGVQPGDVVFNALGYHLTPGGHMMDEAAHAVGAVVIPGGVGNRAAQVEAISYYGATTYLGTPSYLKALLEEAEELGCTLALQRAFVAAEPLPPSLREILKSYGLIIRQGYGTAETGNLGYECEAEDGFHVPHDALVQVCDPDTGEPLPPGETGEVVVTLFNPYYAIIRFGTGDLSSWHPSPCTCRRHTPRLAGWQGRVGDGVKVRGMFLYPKQAAAVLARHPQVERYQFVITRQNHIDSLACNVVLAPGTSDPTKALEAAIRDGLKFNAAVKIVNYIDDDSPVVLDERDWTEGQSN